MDWQREYMALTERDREELARIVSLLFEQTFLLRDVWDAKERRTVTNRDYRFVERVLPVLQAYLAVSGFQLQVDGRRGVMALYNRFGRNRARVDKLTTYVLYTLRLIYDEQMEQASMRHEVVIPLQELIAKLHTLGLVDRRLAATQLEQTLNRLRRRGILARVAGNARDLDSRWLIYPSITILVSDERINLLYDRLQGSQSGTLTESDDLGVENDPDEEADNDVEVNL
ncbi:DUF4194 domain-containing protein [Alicyclobacillus herbarius]|uniref:DUF4194 domain-containing protein n=1 Tax=Alicyclobacillus herbarius TaxID=122960 RepID=UPI000414099F|nr:DUF4194 domain-containing protein [Alicyclobacillus herbarius]